MQWTLAGSVKAAAKVISVHATAIQCELAPEIWAEQCIGQSNALLWLTTSTVLWSLQGLLATL